MSSSQTRTGRLGVGIIGAGHVGPILGSALRAVGHSIVGISASSPESRERADVLLPGVPILDTSQILEYSELVLICIPDDQITGLVDGLAALEEWRQGQIVVHTSGVHGISVLDAARRQGAIPLAIHPAMTFTGTSLDIPQLEGTPFAVTAPTAFLPIAQALVVEMGGEPFVVSEEQRALYHCALSHAANHLVTLIVGAFRALEASGIHDPGAYMRPLLETALERVSREGELALSGPVKRADSGTIAAHMRALQHNPQLSDVESTYSFMTEETLTMLQKSGKIDNRKADKIQTALMEGSDDSSN